jgi:hypothetical protein
MGEHWCGSVDGFHSIKAPNGLHEGTAVPRRYVDAYTTDAPETAPAPTLLLTIDKSNEEIAISSMQSVRAAGAELSR